MKILSAKPSILAFLFFVFAFTGYTQPITTVPGVFIYDILRADYFKVSNAGNSIALKRGTYQYVLFDINKGAITQANRDLMNISSDHRYLFETKSIFVRNNEKNESRRAWEIKSAGIATDTTLRRLVIDYYALDVNEKNIIATKIWYDSSNNFLSGMKGVYKIDRLSGKLLQTLREDTLFTCKDYNGCLLPALHLQKNYLAFSAKRYLEEITILPFGSTNKIIIPAHSYHTAMADSLFLFTIGDSTLNYRHINAFDVRTGEQLAHKKIDRPNYYGQLFQNAGNKLYIFQYGQEIQEETLGKTGFITTKTWNITNSLALAKDQNWDFSVIKGPSFFIAPSSVAKSEAGGMASNSAQFLQGNSNKVSFQVYPFYNRTADDIAKQEKYKKDSEAFLAKIQAEKDSLAHPERYCHLFWNTQKYRRGLTIFWGGAYHIMADYDCKIDKYKLWKPAQLYNGSGHYMTAKYVMVSGREFREGNYYTNKTYVTCSECDGDGSYDVTIYTTKTKDLPWGYFSGIETKKITTTSTTMKQQCKRCMGNGVELKGR